MRLSDNLDFANRSYKKLLFSCDGFNTVEATTHSLDYDEEIKSSLM